MAALHRLVELLRITKENHGRRGLTRGEYCGERHLRRLVLTHAGLEPRTFQRVARFQRFLALAERTGGDGSLAGLAARAGYADQAHLSREVRALSGLTPTALLAERRP